MSEKSMKLFFGSIFANRSWENVFFFLKIPIIVCCFSDLRIFNIMSIYYGDLQWRSAVTSVFAAYVYF